MLEHDRRVRLLPQRVPDRLPERLGAVEPALPVRTVPRRRDAPVVERRPVHGADRAEALAVGRLLVRRHDRDRPAAGVGDQLDRERAEPARAAPHQHGVARLHRVRRPAEEHPVGGPAGERGRRGLLPRQVVGLREALVVLDLGELGHRAPARVVAPHPERARQPGVLARAHPGVVEVPLPRMHHDLVADRDVRDLAPHGVHDAARVGPDDVEVGRLTPARLRARDVHRDAAGRPHVVEVHAGGHRGDEHVARPQLGDVEDLVLDRHRGLPEPVGPHRHRVHPRRHLARRRQLADVVQVLAHPSHPSGTVASGREG